MSAIPVYWIAHDGCVRCRWDEIIVEELITGAVKRPAGFPRVDIHTEMPEDAEGFGIIVFPVGTQKPYQAAWLNQRIAQLDNPIVIVCSNEGGDFPDYIDRRRARVWRQTPRPEKVRKRTAFLPEGSANARAILLHPGPKTLDWVFMGQGHQRRRKECVEVLRKLPNGRLMTTHGFSQGLPREEYLWAMQAAKVVPCPAGHVTQDTFRAFEALEAGAVPVLDAERNDGGGHGYWDHVLGSDHPLPIIADWSEFPRMLEYILAVWPRLVVDVHSWWHQHRRNLQRKLMRQLPRPERTAPRDRMTVVIPTSPIPSHPSTLTIERTIRSIRETTEAEILIMCDGVRPEQEHYSAAYHEYLRVLCAMCEQWRNVTPIVFAQHLHQAEMLRRTLEMVDSEFIVYVEHDTPLVGYVPWEGILQTMDAQALNLMRFYHEKAIHPEHEYLMLDRAPVGEPEQFVRTIQWSQRPHVARTDFYRWVLDHHFARGARTMIEDVMYGVVVNHGKGNWDRFRLAIYHPPTEHIQFSDHLDGREGDPKFDMHFEYPNNEVPFGAPNPRTGA